MRKRILSLLLAAALLLGCCPVTARAAEDSGQLTDELSWYFDSTVNMLHIMGNGNLCLYSEAPWSAFYDSIEEVVISGDIWSDGLSIGEYVFCGLPNLKRVSLYDRVTQIGTGAFSDCPMLEWVTMCEGLEVIGDSAFFNCESLQTVELPSSLTEIGDSAFSYCRSLSACNLPENGVTLGECVFEGCTGLYVVAIPGGSTEVSPGLFSGCTGLQGVFIPEGVTTIGADAFRDCVGFVDLTLPESLKTIEEGAFCGSSIDHTLVIPEAVTYIGYSAFGYSPQRVELHFMGDAPTMEYNTFEGSTVFAYYPEYNYTWDEIVGYDYGGNVSWQWMNAGEPVTIGGYCGESVTWTLNTETGQLTITGTGEMYNYEENGAPWSNQGRTVRSVEIGEGVTNVGNHAFHNMEYLESVDLASTVTTIGTAAFRQCELLKTVTHRSTLTRIHSQAFYQCFSLESFRMPKSVTYIGSEAFGFCQSLTSVIIPAGITGLGRNAFAFCEGLKEIVFNGDGFKMGYNAFSGVTATAYYPARSDTWTNELFATSGGNLTWVAYEPHEYPAMLEGSCGRDVFWSLNEVTGALTVWGTGGISVGYSLYQPWYNYKNSIRTLEIQNGITSVGPYAFYDVATLEAVAFPQSLKTIDRDAFRNCTGLTAAAIPAGVQTINEQAFVGCSGLEGIWVNENNPYYCSDEQGVLYNKDKTTLVNVPGGITGEYAVAQGVTAIGPYAFASHKNLTGVILPDSVTEIYYSAFLDSESIGSIVIPAAVTEIGMYAFSHCGIREVTFTGDAPLIAANAFEEENHTNKVTAYYPAGNATWTKDKRSNYGGYLTWVEFVPTSGACGENAAWSFDGTTGTLTVSGTGDMREYEETTAQPWCALSDRILHVVIEDGITRIGGTAFAGLTNLADVSIPESVTFISGCAFADCYSLTGVEIPDSVTGLGESAFGGCRSLSELILPVGVTFVGDSAFASCSGLTRVVIPKSLTRIESSVFARCTGLTKVEIPGTVRSLEAYAFIGCTGLTEITFLGDAPGIGMEVFAGVVATAYYPAGNETWTEEVCRNYGGKINWIPYETEKNGVYEENGLLYYYVDGEIQYGAGLIFLDGDYYYIRSGGYAAVGEYWVTVTNDLLPQRKYKFGADGRLIFGKHGIIEENGGLYYYFADILQPGAGLIVWEGAYYYVRSSGAVATGNYWVTVTNDLLPERMYHFGEDGKLVWGRHGIIEENGDYYYYFADVLQAGAGLILWENDYYYVRSSGAVATGNYWVTNSNGLLPEGMYTFGADGKLELGKHGIVEENGGYYYYIANKLQPGAGLILWENHYYYIRSSGQAATGRYWVTNTNDLMKEGYYTFDEQGRMIP